MKLFKTIAVIAFLVLPVSHAGAETTVLRYNHYIDARGHRMSVPMEIYLTREGGSRIAVKLAGNLGVVQANLPAFLSQVIEDSCKTWIGFQLDDTRAEGDKIRARGRVQIKKYLCIAPGRRDHGLRWFTNTADVDVLIGADIRNDCLHAQLETLSIDPSGLVGGILDLTGLTEKISAALQQSVNEVLNDRSDCIDFPEKLDRRETRIYNGGFRDFGQGRLGFVITGGITLIGADAVRFILDIKENGLGKSIRSRVVSR